MLVQFNLHGTGYVVAEFSPLIIDETVYTQIYPSRIALIFEYLTYLKINPFQEP